MVLAFTAEGLLWKSNKRDKYTSMLGISVWSSIAGIVFGAIWTAIDPSIWHDVTWRQVGLTFVISIFMSVRLFSWLGVLKRMHISIAEPLSLLPIVVIVPLSWWLFGGTLIWIEITLLVVILLFGSKFGYFQTKHEISNCECGKFKKGLLFLVLWASAAIPSDLLIQYVSESGLSPGAYQLMRRSMITAIVGVALFAFNRKKFKPALLTGLKCPNFALIAVTSVIGGATYFALAGTMNVGVLNAINVATTVLIVLGGALFFRERLRWYNYIFVSIILGSIVALSIVGS